MGRFRYGIHNMGIVSTADQAARMPGIAYSQKVKSSGPIAYWIMGEAAGLVSIDQINSPAQDGAYTGVTLAQPGIGDGNTCPFFDGANDYNNVYTVTFRGVFNGAEGTILIWSKVTNAGVWTDGVQRMMFYFRVDGNNFININKNNANNQIQFVYRANATNSIVTHNLVAPPTDWFVLAITWSKSTLPTGEMKAYYGLPNELAQVGATQVALGVWAGNLAATFTTIGSLGTGPASVFNGYLAHCAVWGSALDLPTLQGLGMV